MQKLSINEMEQKLTLGEFDSILEKSIQEINKKIELNFGVLIAIYQKIEFSRWLELELFDKLGKNLKKFENELSIKHENNSVLLEIENDGSFLIGLQLKVDFVNYDYRKNENQKNIELIKNERITNFTSPLIQYDHLYFLTLIMPLPKCAEDAYHEFIKSLYPGLKDESSIRLIDGPIFEEFVLIYFLQINKISPN